jgi:hypothetical protein
LNIVGSRQPSIFSMQVPAEQLVSGSWHCRPENPIGQMHSKEPRSSRQVPFPHGCDRHGSPYWSQVHPDAFHRKPSAHSQTFSPPITAQELCAGHPCAIDAPSQYWCWSVQLSPRQPSIHWHEYDTLSLEQLIPVGSTVQSVWLVALTSAPAPVVQTAAVHVWFVRLPHDTWSVAFNVRPPAPTHDALAHEFPVEIE